MTPQWHGAKPVQKGRVSVWRTSRRHFLPVDPSGRLALAVLWSNNLHRGTAYGGKLERYRQRKSACIGDSTGGAKRRLGATQSAQAEGLFTSAARSSGADSGVVNRRSV